MDIKKLTLPPAISEILDMLDIQETARQQIIDAARLPIRRMYPKRMLQPRLVVDNERK